MLCQNCGENEGNVKYTQIINGVKKEMVLCEKCSKELGIGNFDLKMPISFSSFFGDLVNEYNDANYMPIIPVQKQLKCDFCNMTYDEFMKTGKFGCSNCYDAFSQRIEPVLKRLHGNTKYLGRKGKLSNIEMKKANNVETNSNETSNEDKLKEELKIAIKEERYEDAAKIRDELKKLGQ